MPRGVRTGRRRSQRRDAGDSIRRGAGESGYNMVVLMVLVTVLSVLVAAALPAWSTVIQREKEEELIFRGLQYAEALRVFEIRFGRPPNRLEELLEVEPRSIRRLWKDPMTGEARWGLIFAGAGTPIPGQNTAGQQGGIDVGGGSGPQAPPPITNDPDELTQGPITGVYSLADGESILEFDGRRSYSQWHFTVELVRRIVNPEPVNPGPWTRVSRTPPPGLPDFSARWVGRPWPRELQPNMGQGGMPPGAGVSPGQPGQSSTGLPAAVPDGGSPRR